MSIRIMSQVWDTGPDNQGELLVLLALADFADDEGRCFPSIESVAKKARMSARNARRVVRNLENEGRLKVDRSSGRSSNRYQILSNPDKLSGSPQPGQMAQSTRTNGALNPDICDTNPDTAMSAYPSIEPSRTVREPSERVRARRIIAEVIGDELTDDFLKMRQSIRKPLVTERAAKLLVAELKKCPDPIASAQTSILHCWQSVYPERKSHERNRNDGEAAARAERAAERWEARRVGGG